MIETNKIYEGDCLEVLKIFPNESINCVMTSPPYWALRDYGVEGQLGLEPTFQEYINKLCDIFEEVKRVLRKDGNCWINIGDTYSGSSCGVGDTTSTNRNKPESYKEMYKGQKAGRTYLPDKSLCMIPFRFAIEMVNRGWILRNVIIWHKPNCMPSSVKDRFTVDFEYLFFFVKNKTYWFETQYEKIYTESTKQRYKKILSGEVDKLPKKIKKYSKDCLSSNFSPKYFTLNPQGRNKRTIWSICPKPFSEAHFATYPEELCEIPIKAGCPLGGIVLDPFFGAGTTGLVALKQNKKFIGIELNPQYIEIAKERLKPYIEQMKL